MYSGSENDLTSVEHDLPLFLVNSDDSHDITAAAAAAAAAAVTAVSLL